LEVLSFFTLIIEDPYLDCTIPKVLAYNISYKCVR